ncbi:site-2 protease family protein [Microseira sp. BLCC-F43]|jgi:membrane-associated protease RseP (regulator of RpoE activity)|uniref:site-2 protease family protein n=1 Tax=Microseira sp. BLCC-F43 TaxID=3153602 RepID=UPI0035B928ED
MNLFLLLVLGLVTYFIVQRSVASITKTPVWILWLVMMTPAFIWSGWIWIYGKEPPLVLLLGPFIICPILYWWLIHLGRRELTPEEAKTTDSPVAAQTLNGDAQKQTVRALTSEEEATLRNCFPWSIYYLQNLEYRPQAVICRGSLRSNPEVAYKTIKQNIEAQFSDRFYILFQEDFTGKPFFALVPNPQAHREAKRNSESLTRPGLALALLLVTLFTTTIIGAEIANVTEAAVKSNPGALLQGLPYALSLMTILGIHELGHYLAARRYKIRTTLPYFIPVPFFLGTFGAFIQMRSPVPNRKALFDVAIAGPLAGFIVTIPLLIWGLANSSVVPLSDKSGMLNFDSFNPRFSLLMTLLSQLTLGSALTSNMAIDLHPVAVAGYLGIIVTALNLMPVGQLDGGHIIHAMLGQQAAIAIGQVARLLLLGWSLVQPGFLLWAILLFLMPVNDEPALNDVSALDNQRDFWGLLAIALLIAMILPMPPMLRRMLGI